MATSRLYVRAPDEGTRIEVLDPNLQPLAVAHNAGEVSVTVSPGVYAVRFRRGLAVTEKLALVGKDGEEVRVTLDEDEEPVFATAAPVAQASATSKPQQAAAERLSRSTPHVIGGRTQANGRLLLFVRSDTPSTTRLDAGISVHRLSGEEVARSEALAEVNLEEGWAGLHLELATGAYRVRRTVNESAFEQIVHVHHGWQTQYFALALANEEGAADFALLAVLMAQGTVGFDGSKKDGRYTEAALRALRERSSIPGPMSQEMLDGKFENPLLGVMAALLQLRRDDADLNALRRVVDNLLWLVQPSPDVLAIGLGMMTRDPGLRELAGFKESIRNPAVLSLPPYFSESWRHIYEASQWDATLIPTDSVAARVALSITQATPWFRWRVSEERALVVRPSDSLSRRGGGFSGLIRNVVEAVTPVLEDVSVKALGLILETMQATLARLDDVNELLRTSAYSELDRRIVAFVYPLTDPALIAMLATTTDRGDALRTAVLTRGRDGREMARALQLPLGTAILSALRLGTKITLAAGPYPTKFEVDTFVTTESQGDANLRAALEALRAIDVPVRRPGKKQPLNALEYLVLRYSEAAKRAKGAPASPRPEPELLDVNTGEPVSGQVSGDALRTAQRALAAEISRLTRAGTLSLVPARKRLLVAPVSRFKTGHLLPAVVKAAGTSSASEA